MRPRTPGRTDGAHKLLGALVPVMAWATVTDGRTGTVERRPLRTQGDVFRARLARTWCRTARPWRVWTIAYTGGRRDVQGDTDESVR